MFFEIRSIVARSAAYSVAVHLLIFGLNQMFGFTLWRVH